MNYSGLGLALVTPFNNRGEIDYDALKRIVDRAITGGVDYFVLFGTTGEAPTISLSEKQEALKVISAHVGGAKPIVLGFGANNTTKLLEEMNLFDFTGADALLSVIPYYNKPNQDGMYMHYKTIADASPLPVILYNVPGRTVVNMEAETSIRIAQDCKNVNCIKEATDNLDQVMDLLNNKPEDLTVVAGDDALALPIIALGGSGVISVIANAYPADFATMVHAALEGDFEKARYFHYKLLPIIHGLLTAGNPSGIKAVLHIQGMIEHVFRLPVHPVNEQKMKEIIEIVKKID